MKIKPKPGYLTVKEKSQEASVGSFEIPIGDDVKSAVGEVLEVGEVKEVETDVKVGEEVVFSKYAGNDVPTTDGIVKVVLFEDVIAEIIRSKKEKNV